MKYHLHAGEKSGYYSNDHFGLEFDEVIERAKEELNGEAEAVTIAESGQFEDEKQ